MLVLTAREGEQVFIGDSISVTVVKAHGNRMTLGFEAPREVTILRESVKRRVDANERRKRAGT
jgi:carbon storage regulator